MMVLAVCAMFLMAASPAFAGDVYATKSGKKYHKEDCRLIQNRDSEKISSKEAEEKGLKPCGKCFKGEVSSSSDDAKSEKLASKKSKSKEE